MGMTMNEQNILVSVKEQLVALPIEEREALLAKIRLKLALSKITTTGQAAQPLTSAQQRLWLLEKFDRVPYIYHVPLILELPLNVDHTKLTSAFTNLGKEQTQLRSYFVEEEGVVLQNYVNNITPNIKTITITEPFPAILDVQEGSALSEFMLKPFQLDKAPLFRVAIVKAPEGNYLIICCHHMIIDGWSAELLMKYISESCNQPVPPLIKGAEPTSYQDYRVMEQQLLQNSGYAAELSYWQKRLENRNWEVNLFTDFSRPRHLSGYGRQVIHEVKDELLQQLGEFAKQHHVSINHVILQIFVIILARYSGQDDVTVGMPVAGRRNKKWHNTIGLFVNTCLHATTLNYQMSFLLLLLDLKTQLHNDIANAEIPFDFLVKHFYQHQLCPPGTSFNILYNFLQTQNNTEVDFSGASAKTRLCLLPCSKFDLSLHALLQSDSLTLIFEYSTCLFQVGTVKQIMRDFSLYLEKFIQSPNESIANLLWSVYESED
jgi:hypothetical protein